MAGGVEAHLIRDRKILTRANLYAETLMLGINGAVASAESRKKGARVKDVTAQAHAEGRHTGKAPLGLRWIYPGLKRVERGTLTIDEPVAAKIRKLFDVAATGALGLSDLRRTAIEMRLLTQASSPTTIRLLLSHPIYVGGFRQQGPKATCIDSPDGSNPKIVDRAIWQKVQNIYFGDVPRTTAGPRASHQGRAASAVLSHVFSCRGQTLTRNSARDQWRWRDPSNDSWHGFAESELVDLLVERVLGPVSVPPRALEIFTRKLRSHIEDAVPSQRDVHGQIEKLRKKALRLLETIADPDLCSTQDERAALQAKRAKLLAEIEELSTVRDDVARAVPAEAEVARMIDYVCGLGEGWRGEDEPTKRQILLGLLDFAGSPPVELNEDGAIRSIRYAPGWADLQEIVAESLREFRQSVKPTAWRADPELRGLVAAIDAELARSTQVRRITAGSGRGSGSRGPSSAG